MTYPPDNSLRIALFNDSATMRAVIRTVLSQHDDLLVVAEAADGTQADVVCREARADLVLMDIVMPRCNGYEATRKIMASHPLPIIMVSSAVDTQSAAVLFEALKAGALFVTEAPPAGFGPAEQIKRAAFVQTLRNVVAGTRLGGQETPPTSAALPTASNTLHVDAIGLCASAGGPAAVTAVLSALPATGMPPILLVQHLARGFVDTFARWLSNEAGRNVFVAAQGMPLETGGVYLAPDDAHLGYGMGGVATLSQSPPIGMFRPSATFLLRSLRSLGNRALGVVLSGMGNDGAQGAVEMRACGGQVAVQDRQSCAVYGMPQAALALGGADEVLDPARIGEWLIRRCGVNR